MRSFNKVEFGHLCNRAPRTVQRWIDAGMPHSRNGRRYQIALEDALPWVMEFLQQPYHSQSESERLRKEQADKVALQNETTRSNLVRVDHMRAVVARMDQALSQHLEGSADRLAVHIAGETAPAMIRQTILNDHHAVQFAYGQKLQSIFENSQTDSLRGKSS